MSAPVVWNVASHHPERCHGVAALCVPYRTVELGLEHLVALVDRRMYPVEEFPWGQWDYQAVYLERPAEVAAPSERRYAPREAKPGQVRGHDEVCQFLEKIPPRR